MLRGGAGLALAAAGGFAQPSRAEPGRGGVPFGAAIQAEYFDADEEYAAAFLAECDMIVPMNELKFWLVHPERGQFDYSRSDMLVDFALDNRRTSRGHTFVWYNTNPPWLEAITDPAELEGVLRQHIGAVAGHYSGKLVEWDVVNEVIAHDPRGADGPLRDTIWMRALGPRHIPVAFEEAALADPNARLVINEYDLEFTGERYDARRGVMLDIVRQLQDGGLKVDAVGLQGHLYSHLEVDVEGLAAFARELRSLGVGIVVTELDIIDFQVRGGVEEQDTAAMRSMNDLLDALSDTPPSALVAWGLTDRYSWVGEAMPRDDGRPVRPLPFDAEMRPKPWYDTLRRRLAEM